MNEAAIEKAAEAMYAAQVEHHNREFGEDEELRAPALRWQECSGSNQELYRSMARAALATAKVFILEWSGCECGGTEKIAFTSREKAEAWIAENSHEVRLGGGRSFMAPNASHGGWEILEVDLT